MRTFHLSGHIGAGVSALVDGQLSAEEEERAWAHVMACPGCRRLVEREGWTKTQLRSLSDPAPARAPSHLIGALYDVDAWAEVDRIERASMRRRAAVVAVGAGSLGFVALAIVAATTPPVGRNEVPGSPTTALIRSEQNGASVGADVGAGAGDARVVSSRHAAR
jgi:anti-sigma factor RsiW